MIFLSSFLTELTGCTERALSDPSLQKERVLRPAILPGGSHWPEKGEAETVGPILRPLTRAAVSFGQLVQVETTQIVFKDEEGTGADRLMTPELRSKLLRLSALAEREWSGQKLRVTEAWDEDLEHGPSSLHYEGRAVDVTTTDREQSKLARLSGLAIQAGFDWVSHEETHVHASVRH